MLCPREAVVEPWLVPVGYAESARLHNADIRLGTAAVGATFDRNKKVWTIDTKSSQIKSIGRSGNGEILTPIQNFPSPFGPVSSLHAKTVINCAGLYGDTIEQFRVANLSQSDSGVKCGHSTQGTMGTSPSGTEFTITPRKGQFVVFNAPPQAVIPNHIIEPVATQFTKGVIVWQDVYGNVVVGPTAIDQRSKTDRSTDDSTVAMLREYGETVLPGLRDAKVLGTYSGLRPATEHRDYFIEPYPDQNWITVSGIRSTGLTASSGIAEYVIQLYEAMVNPSNKPCTPFANESQGTLNLEENPRSSSKSVIGTSIPGDRNKLMEEANSMPGVTEAACHPDPLDPRVKVANGPIPSLDELSESFNALGDGTVEVYGRTWRVTHPISSFGMETRARNN